MVKPDRERYVWLYCKSVEDKQRYQALADESKAPLSKFLLGVIEDALAARDNEQTGPTVVKELQTLREENMKLREDLKLRTMLIDKLQNENERFKAALWTDEAHEGFRGYDLNLIDTLKNRSPIQPGRLFEALEIEPGDTDRIEATSRQLEALETHGIVKLGPRGWVWC